MRIGDDGLRYFCTDPKVDCNSCIPMTKVTVSVVIPTYNHAQYILQSLASVFSQEFKDYEIIVINDGSPDETAALLQPLADVNKIIYLDQPNSGQAKARNCGLAKARGEFIAFLDDDDCWTTGNLEAQVHRLQQAQPGTVACAGQCRFVAGTELPPPDPVTDESVSLGALLHKNCIHSPGQVVIRKDALVAAGGFGAVKGGADDWDCWLRLAKHGKIIASEHVALLYTLHQTNASRDAIAMLRSADAVVSKHTEDVPPPVRVAAFTSLLDQSSVFVAHQMTAALKRAHLRTCFSGLRCLFVCLGKAGWRMGSLQILARAFTDVFKANTRSKARPKAA